MVTVANVVGHSGKIALAKPYLIPKITEKLLLFDKIKTTPHLTAECKLVIAQSQLNLLISFLIKLVKKKMLYHLVKNIATAQGNL